MAHICGDNILSLIFYIESNNIFISSSTTFVPEDLIDKNSALVQVMACYFR